jgi:4-amino-4-deoxy-L-arabinose transferase-like glycosyltransferase
MSAVAARPPATESLRRLRAGQLLPWAIGGGLLLLSLLTRLPAFAMSVVDWDESLYFIMAEQWRAGHLPYTTVWDNKPIGIYAIFAAFQSLLGDTPVSMRVAGVLAIAATAILAWRITRHLLRDLPPLAAELAGALAGVLFIVTTISDDGIASNTEIFMEAFTCLGMLLALTPVGRIGRGRAFGIGLSLGVAFMIKYVAVFDMFAVFFAMTALPGRASPGRASPGRTRLGLGRLWDVLRLGIVFSLGALAPFVAAVLLYAAHGRLGVFLQASLLSNLRRVAIPLSGNSFVSAFGAQAALYPALYVALVWVAARLRVARVEERWGIVTLLGWAVTSAVGVASGGLYFSHYFIQLLPVLCIATAVMVAQVAVLMGGWPRALLLVLIASRLIAPIEAAWVDLGRMIPIAMRPPVGFGLLRDTPAQVAADLRPELAQAPGQTIYVFDGEPVLYSLLHARLPTKYVFPSFLLSRLLSYTVNIDPLAQLDAIMAERPLFVIRRRDPGPQSPQTRNVAVYAKMAADLAADYTVWRVYDDMVVYRLR